MLTKMSENVKEIQRHTIIYTESCKFIWSIEKFSLCGLQGEEYMNSPVFITGTSLLTTWHLRLYPNRNKTVDKDGNVSIQLLRSTTDSSAHYVQFQLSIIDSTRTKLNCKPETFCLFNETKSDWGYKNFISRTVLFGTQESSFLPQDMLTIMCELKTSRVDDYKTSELTEVPKPTTSTVVFKKPDSLMDDLRQFYENQMHTDFTLKVGNEEFKVHKNILCARSSVFNTMLSCEMKEKLTNCVKITDFDPNTVKMLLHYIYSGQVEDLTPEISIQLYFAAEKYNLQDLKDICVEYLSKNLIVDNFCDVLTLGGLHNETRLMTILKNFFSENAAVIKGTENWLNLSKTNPDLVIAMYEVVLSKIKI